MENHPALKTYIRKIKRFLPCSGSERTYILTQIQEQLLDYLYENPEADLAAMENQFGTPREIANHYWNDQETPVLLNKMNSTKNITRIFAATMAAALLIWIAAVTFELYTDQKADNGYYIVTCGQINS